MFDLRVDLGERYDISAPHPEILAAVVAAAEHYQDRMTVGEPLFDLRGES